MAASSRSLARPSFDEGLPGTSAHRAWTLRTLVSGAVAICVFTAFLAYYGLSCLQPDWGGDFQLYCAALARLYRDLLHPMHESLNVPGSQSMAYTPFLVSIALLGKLFGATPFRALQIAGLFNLSLFAFGACFLFSRVSIHRQWWLPAASFIFTTLFLRWLHFGWSSETSLTNLQYVQPYPSTFSWALAFIAFGLLDDVRTRRRPLELVALIAVISLLLACHVLTGSWVVGVVGLYGLWVSVQEKSARPLAWASFAIGAGLVPVLLWPYQPFFGQSSMQAVNEGSQFGRSPFIEFPNLYGLAIACFAYVLVRLRRHGFWLLALLATLGVLFVFRQAGMSYGNRYAFFAAFFPQFIVAEVMALGIFALLGPLPELSPSRKFADLDRPLLVALLAVALTVWLPSPMLARARQTVEYGTLWSPRALLQRPSPHDAYYRQYAEVTALVSADDLVIMPVARAVLDFASITGASVVATPLAAKVPDGGQRFRDVNRFFDPKASPRERVGIAEKYGATKVLVPSWLFILLPELVESFGEPIHHGEAYALFRVKSSARADAEPQSP